jgi:hypothetical protein
LFPRNSKLYLNMCLWRVSVSIENEPEVNDIRSSMNRLFGEISLAIESQILLDEAFSRAKREFGKRL